MFRSPNPLGTTSSLSSNNALDEALIYAELETPIKSPIEQTYNPFQETRRQTPDYHRIPNRTRDMNDFLGIQHEVESRDQMTWSAQAFLLEIAIILSLRPVQKVDRKGRV